MSTSTVSASVAAPHSTGESKAKNIVLWVIQILVAAAFLNAGIRKLIGHPMNVATFTTLGLGQWLRYAVAAIEVIAPLMLLRPRFAVLGAELLIMVALGATAAQLLILQGSPVAPLVLGLLCGVILRGRWHMTQNRERSESPHPRRHP